MCHTDLTKVNVPKSRQKQARCWLATEGANLHRQLVVTYQKQPRGMLHKQKQLTSNSIPGSTSLILQDKRLNTGSSCCMPWRATSLLFLPLLLLSLLQWLKLAHSADPSSKPAAVSFYWHTMLIHPPRLMWFWFTFVRTFRRCLQIKQSPSQQFHRLLRVPEQLAPKLLSCSLLRFSMLTLN
jgi:hypothetical protein